MNTSGATHPARALLWRVTLAAALLLPRGAEATPQPPRPSPGAEASGESAKTRRRDKAKEQRPRPREPAYQSVVTARREPEDPFRSDRTVQTVTRKELRRLTPRTLPEALWDSAGVFVQQTNHGGGSPILRGMVGPQVLILVDGVRLNNSVYRSGPVQYLNLIDPYSIDRIEVLRGPGSVLYGSDAMGGVIQAFPTGPQSFGGAQELHVGGRLLHRYSSADRGQTTHGQAELSYAGFGVVGGWTTKFLSDLAGGRGVGVQPYSGYDHTSAMGAVQVRIHEGLFAGWRVKVGYLLARIDGAGRTDKLFTQNSLQLYDNDSDLLYGQLHLRLRPLRTRGRLILSYQRFFERKDAIGLADDYQTEQQTTRDETQVHTVGLDLQLQTRILGSRLQLQYGASWYRDAVDSSRAFRLAGEDFATLAERPYPSGSTYQNWGAFALLEGSPLRRKGHELRLTAGYRVHGMIGEAPAADTLPAVTFSHIGHVFLASARYTYQERATLALSFSQGFRAPNLFEAVMLGDSGQFFHIPNAALGPERSDTLELLFRGRLGRLTLGTLFYVTLLHNLIRRDFTEWEGQEAIDGKPVTWNINAGEGMLFGMAGQLHLRLGRGFSLAGSVTYTWGEEWTEGGLSLPLRLVPPLFGGARLRYEWKPIGGISGFAETSIRGAAKQNLLSPEDEKDSRIPDGGTPGWLSWNLRVGVTLWRKLRVILAVDNLTNAPYRYHGSGVYAAGTNVMLTVDGSLFL